MQVVKFSKVQLKLIQFHHCTIKSFFFSFFFFKQTEFVDNEKLCKSWFKSRYKHVFNYKIRLFKPLMGLLTKHKYILQVKSAKIT